MSKKSRRRVISKLADKGVAATPAPKEVRRMVVLFADIIGCSEISNRMGLKAYNKFLDEFHSCFEKVCEHYMKQENYNEDEIRWDCRGDEGCLQIFSDPSKRRNAFDFIARDVDVAIDLALDLKREWLFVDHNQTRINQNLLPVGLAIGIHIGRAWLNKDESSSRWAYRPEGYAINLAKRIEGASRDGKFTNVLLSEAARGCLHLLTDEPTYRFADAFLIQPKGITQTINVFELKHHFLATDWTDKVEETSVIYNTLSNKEVQLIKGAREANPTNLWLAEEYLVLRLMNQYKSLPDREKEDTAGLKRAYMPVLEEARDIANMHARDPALLAIWAFVYGEMAEYPDEQSKYNEALEMDPKNGELWDYLGYSMSMELHDIKLGGDLDKNFRELPDELKAKVTEILCTYKKAMEFSPMNAWIHYDYGCELSRWGHTLADRQPSKEEKEHRKQAIDTLTHAFSLNRETVERACEEPYVDRVRDDNRIKNFLEK